MILFNQIRAGSEPKEVSKKKRAAQEDEDYSDDEWPSSSDSSSGTVNYTLSLPSSVSQELITSFYL